MIKKIGYACINLHLKPRGFQDCRYSSIYKYGINYLREKIMNNLALTRDILKWNVKNKILMYRVTSKLLPFVTHPDILKDFTWRWQEDEEILSYMKEIKDLVQKHDIRLSMHPDQFTVINSLNEKVIKNSIRHLQYHYEVLEKLGGKDLVIHTGGVYGDKKVSMERFMRNLNTLDEKIKQMLRLENDDVSYDVEDVLYISSKVAIPVVLDLHHYKCNHKKEINTEDMIKIYKTWENTKSIPKMHISSGKTGMYDKRHHDYIKNRDFEELLNLIGSMDFDVMVEAKKKEEAVLRIKKHFHI